MRKLVGVALLGCLAAASGARAESAVDAGSDTGLPGCRYVAPEVTPAPGDIPANWPLITIGLQGTGFDFASATLTRSRDGYAVPLAPGTLGGLAYAPREPLTVGETYVFAHPICAGLSPRTNVFTAIAPVDAPSTVGAFEVLGPYAANRSPGVAYRFYFFVVTLMPDAHFAAAPWSSFRWVVETDGDASSANPETMATHATRIPVRCTGSFGVPEGTHDVGVAAGPIEGLLSIRDAATMPLTVRCADATRVDADTLVPLTPAQIAYWDTAPMDAHHDLDASIPQPMDGAVHIEGGIDGGHIDMHTEPDTHSNCSVSSSRTAVPTWMLLIACLATPSIRRRRARARAARRP